MHVAGCQYCMGSTTNQQPLLTHWYMTQVVSSFWGAGLTNNQSLLIDTCRKLSVFFCGARLTNNQSILIDTRCQLSVLSGSMTNQQPVHTHWNLLQLVSSVWGARLTNSQSLLIETCCKLSVLSGSTTNQQPVHTHWNLLQLVSSVWGTRLSNNQFLLIDTFRKLSVVSEEHEQQTTTPYSLKTAASCQYCLGNTTVQQPVLTHWYISQVLSSVWRAWLTNNHSLLIATCCNLSALSGDHG